MAARVLCALALTVAAQLALSVAAQASFPGANGKIAFDTNRDGNFELYTVNPDGSGSTRLTANTVFDGYPAWSPDGTKIAFTRDATGSGNNQIYVMNADGSGATKLTNVPFFAAEPAWSPDGTKIAFASAPDGNPGHYELYTMNADGTNQVPITNNSTDDEHPDWSPDGTLLAWECNHEICVFKPDGSAPWIPANVRPLGNQPSWSPDSKRIVFASGLDGEGYNELYTMPFDYTKYPPGGSTITRVGSNSNDSNSFFPEWSPDGKLVAHDRRTCPSGLSSCSSDHIWSIGVDGSGLMNLSGTSSVSVDSAPSWQAINPAPYARPVGASPMRISLVPAFTPCDSGSANALHALPFLKQSCSPPKPTSSLVAVGPRSIGFGRLVVLGSGECAPFDSTHCSPDVTIRFSISDVRSGSPSGPDYAAPGPQDLTAVATLPAADQGATTQITDQYNQSVGDAGGPYDKSATTVPLEFPVPLDCVAVANPIDGSVCSAQTTANTLVPGSVVAGKRAVWELGQLQVLDLGADGVAGNADDQVFETQGVFQP